MIAAAKPNLSEAESQEFEELIEYRNIFAIHSDDYGWTIRVHRCIDSGEA
jgi:hypothetical protein